MSVTPAMLAVALGQAAPVPGSVTDQQWQMWIEDAEMLIDTRATALSVDPASIDQAKFDYVVREATVAHIRRPDDATQVTTSVDDASSSRTYKSGRGRVVILDEWWLLLGLTDPKGAFSIDMAPGVAVRHMPWCSSMFLANYCSCGADIAGTPIYEGGAWW